MKAWTELADQRLPAARTRPPAPGPEQDAAWSPALLPMLMSCWTNWMSVRGAVLGIEVGRRSGVAIGGEPINEAVES